MSAQPHISPALLALRGWVTAAAGVLALCAIVQLSIFRAVARYTDARTSEVKPPPNAAIVAARESASLSPRSSHQEAAVDPNRVRSVTDYNLAVTSAAASAAGLTALITLILTAGLGAMVAGGGAVPGIQYTVRAFVWTGVCIGLCFPWSGIAGSSMIAGVFCGYPTLTAAAESGTGAATVSHVILPTAVLILAGCIAFWFRRGTAAGIILTSLSEVDEELEREMSLIRKRGVGRMGAGGRAGAVLTQAVATPERMAIPEPGPLRKAAGAESMSDDDMSVSPSLLRRKNPPQRPI